MCVCVSVVCFIFMGPFLLLIESIMHTTYGSKHHMSTMFFLALICSEKKKHQMSHKKTFYFVLYISIILVV